jgi:hypothetical protein
VGAVFLDRRANHLAEERFRDETGFRVVTRGRRERTTVTADEMFPFTLFKTGRAAEVGENAKRGVNPLLAGLAFYFRQMLVRHFPTHLPHPGLQFSRAQFSRENRQNEIDKGTVGFRENLFRVGGEGIGGVRFAGAGLGAGLVNEPVTFQAEKMGADRVVRELQCRSQIVHGLLATSQQLQNLPAGAFKDSFAPARRFHNLRIKRQGNKSKMALTYIESWTS